MIKIDKGFLDGLGRDDRTGAVVAAIVNLAHALELSTVAEGVETLQQLEVLKVLGCDAAQGYLFARPLSADRISMRIARETERLPQSFVMAPASRSQAPPGGSVGAGRRN